MLSGFYFRLQVTFIILMCGQLTYSQESKLVGLLQRSPMPANAICYLHTASLKKLLVDAKLDLELADKVEEVWLVSDLDTETLVPKWEAGYATTKQKLEADPLAKALGGYVDEIGDQKVVWTPRQSYVLPLGQERVGFLRPAKRNLAAQWIDSTSKNPIPAFLDSQSKQAEQYLSFLLAVNLKNLFSPVDLATRLSTFESLKNSDLKAMASLLSTVQGVSIIVGRKSLSECIVTIEFGQSPASLASKGSVFLSEILERNGTSAPEIASWKVTADGNTLSFQGAISADSLDGVLGIFSLRGYAEGVVGRLESPVPPTSQSLMLTASKEYFSKVGTFIERVRKYEAQTTGYRAKWDEQQARRIDELSTLNVDPLLIDYGSNVANMLRGNATSIRSGNVTAGQIQASQANGGIYESNYYGGYYGGYYSDTRYGLSSQAITGAQQRMAGFGSYRETIAAIDKLSGDVRRAMTEKYKSQF